jgi:hypothetical protein
MPHLACPSKPWRRLGCGIQNPDIYSVVNHIAGINVVKLIKKSVKRYANLSLWTRSAIHAQSFTIHISSPLWEWILNQAYDDTTQAYARLFFAIVIANKSLINSIGAQTRVSRTQVFKCFLDIP